MRQTLCPKCGTVMALKKGRYGPFYGCAAYPHCNGAANPGLSPPRPEELNLVSRYQVLQTLRTMVREGRELPVPGWNDALEIAIEKLKTL